jgi:hypothetical protein
VKIATALLLTISALSLWVRAEGNFRHTYSLTAVTQVQLKAFGSVEFTQGDSDQLRVTASEDIADYVQLVTRDNKLWITDTRADSTWFKTQQLWHRITGQQSEIQDINYKITLSNPEALILNGHFTSHVHDIANAQLAITFNGLGKLSAEQLRNDDLTVTVNGHIDTQANQLIARHMQWIVNGDGALNVHAIDSLQLVGQLSGAINCRLSGTTKEIEWHMAGSGACSASRLDAQHAQLEAKGDTYITLKVNQSLNASTEGEGRIHYYGKPQTRTSGSRIKPIAAGYQARIYY